MVDLGELSYQHADTVTFDNSFDLSPKRFFEISLSSFLNHHSFSPPSVILLSSSVLEMNESSVLEFSSIA